MCLTTASDIDEIKAHAYDSSVDSTFRYVSFALYSGGIAPRLTCKNRCITFFVDIASLGMCTIALPTIKEQLGFDEGSLQWVMTAYALTVSNCNSSMVKLEAGTNVISMVVSLWLVAASGTYSVKKSYSRSLWSPSAFSL
jgi:hypothetical protein